MTAKGPIIIIGAGRSGTKLLRGILNQSPETVIFPREINYIWRHGNADFPTDELRFEHARPEVREFVRRQFSALRSRQGGERVVEKTCANALRIQYVHAIFPEAQFVHLIRDGRAVAESARRLWQARPELGYLLEKLRWVPLRDIPHYALRYASFQLSRLHSGNSSSAQSSWGPRFTGLDQAVRQRSLIEVCGIQWRECVRSAARGLSDLPRHQALTCKYEDLVEDPVSVTKNLFGRLGLSYTEHVRDYVTDHVQKGHLDKWRYRLSDSELGLLLQHIAGELESQGYELFPVTDNDGQSN